MGKFNPVMWRGQSGGAFASGRILVNMKTQTFKQISTDLEAMGSSLPHERSTRVMTGVLRRFIRDEEGQDIIEYGLLASFISIVAVLTVKAIGPFVLAMYQLIVTAMTP